MNKKHRDVDSDMDSLKLAIIATHVADAEQALA